MANHRPTIKLSNKQKNNQMLLICLNQDSL